MREVAYLAVTDVDSAIAALSAHENAMLLAGGTNVVDYLRAGAISPSVLIDISAVPLTDVHAGEAGLAIGGLARMSDVAAHPGIEPASGMGAYSVSKAALVHLTHILDIELRPHGIRVNAVAPQLLDWRTGSGFPTYG